MQPAAAPRARLPTRGGCARGPLSSSSSPSRRSEAASTRAQGACLYCVLEANSCSVLQLQGGISASEGWWGWAAREQLARPGNRPQALALQGPASPRRQQWGAYPQPGPSQLQAAPAPKAGSRLRLPPPLAAPHLLAVDGQPLLEGQLEPVAHGHAVAGLVVEELVGDGACGWVGGWVGGGAGVMERTHCERALSRKITEFMQGERLACTAAPCVERLCSRLANAATSCTAAQPLTLHVLVVVVGGGGGAGQDVGGVKGGKPHVLHAPRLQAGHRHDLG